eukprot:gb/GEZN01021130.1/.p1 GENE.gb/GEZN01021130.1/~~gb/GEZN01021130.1/.p1  ORF type:complete len:164 (-),score=8.31 gb/GEZN01021130.1/:109-600(-)
MSQENPKRFMVTVDGSAQAQRAFNTAVEGASKKDVIHVVHSVEPLLIVPMMPLSTGDWVVAQPNEPRERAIASMHETLAGRGSDILDGFMRQCSAKGLTCKKTLLNTYHPREALVKYATENEIDTMYVGSRGLGPVKGLLLGSFSHYLVSHAPCNIMVVKEDA